MSPPLPPLPPAGPEYSLPFKWSQRTTPSPPLPARASIVSSSTSAIKIFKYFYNLKRVEEQKVYGYTEHHKRHYFKKNLNRKYPPTTSIRIPPHDINPCSPVRYYLSISWG